MGILADVTAVVQRQPSRMVVLQLKIGWQNKDYEGVMHAVVPCVDVWKCGIFDGDG